MKRLLTILLLLCATGAWAGIPYTLNYNGVATNTAFSGTESNISFAVPAFGAGIYDGPIHSYTNRGPALGYVYAGTWYPLIGPSGLGLEKQDNSKLLFSVAMPDPQGFAEEIVRIPKLVGKLVLHTNSGNLGAGISMQGGFVGGNAAAMSGLPTGGGDVWERQPICPVYLTAWNPATPYTNQCNQAYVTNILRVFRDSGMLSAYTNAGIPVVEQIDAGWHAAARDAAGGLTWNTDLFGNGMPWLVNYAHTNGYQMILHQYWSSVISNDFFDTVTATYVQQVTTPATADRDMWTLKSWGLDGARVGDGTSLDVGNAAYFARQMVYTIGDAVRAPGGGYPADQLFPNTNKFFLDFFINPNYTPTGWPHELAYGLNHFGDDQGDPSGPNPGTAIDRAMYQSRFSYTNLANYAGKGHYVSINYPNDSGALSVNDLRGSLSMNCIFPNIVYFYGTNFFASGYAATFTNAGLLQVMGDAGQEPGFPLFDNGAASTSAWLKPLAGGRLFLVLANETAGALTVTAAWSQMASARNYMPIGSRFYPVQVATNAVFDVRDIWNGASSGTAIGSFGASVGAHQVLAYILTPSTNALSLGNLGTTNTTLANGLTVNVLDANTITIGSPGKQIMLAQTNDGNGKSYFRLINRSIGIGAQVEVTDYSVSELSLKTQDATSASVRNEKRSIQAGGLDGVAVSGNAAKGEIQFYHDPSVAPVVSFYSGESASGVPVGYLAAPIVRATNGIFNGTAQTVSWTVGSGSPEGVVTKPIGSLYSRTDGGAATSLYVKESGAGNTGWVGK